MYCPTHSRSFPKWDDVCSRMLHIARLESIENGVERMGAMEAYARERAGESLEEQLASIEDSRERWKVIAAARDLTDGGIPYPPYPLQRAPRCLVENASAQETA